MKYWKALVIGLMQFIETVSQRSRILTIKPISITPSKDPIQQTFIFKAKIRRIVDGDTIDVDIPIGFGVTKVNQRIRVNNIDTPESRINTAKEGSRSYREIIDGKSLAARTLEKKMGKAAKVRMKELCGKEIYIDSLNGGKDDKYGRLLADLYTLDGLNICTLLIMEGHAVEYQGKTKTHIWGS